MIEPIFRYLHSVVCDVIARRVLKRGLQLYLLFPVRSGGYQQALGKALHKVSSPRNKLSSNRNHPLDEDI